MMNIHKVQLKEVTLPQREKQAKKVGRPPVSEDERLEARTSVGMTMNEYNQFVAFAGKYDWTLSKLFRTATKDFMKRQEKDKGNIQ